MRAALGRRRLDAGTVTIRWQIIQNGWLPQLDTPKTDSSQAPVALDQATIAVLRHHRVRQNRERLAAGQNWTDSGLVFTTPTGTGLHPAAITDDFHDLLQQAGLPPIRFHDLRHGAATSPWPPGWT